MNEAQTAGTYMPEEQFNATLRIGDGYVSIVSRTLADLAKTVAQLRPVERVGQVEAKLADKPLPPSPGVGRCGEHGQAEAKLADKPLPADPKPTPKKEAAAQVEKQPAPAAAEPAALSNSAAPAADEPARPTYDDVKRAVLALAKISPDTAKATLAKFTGQNGQPCDHGTKLKLEDYPAFLKAAEEVAA